MPRIKGDTGPTNAERVLELTEAEAMSRADLAAALGVSERYMRKVITALREPATAKRLFIERWGMIERDKSGPMYVPIYRRKTALGQADARRPKGTARSRHDYEVKKAREALAAGLEWQAARLLQNRKRKK